MNYENFSAAETRKILRLKDRARKSDNKEIYFGDIEEFEKARVTDKLIAEKEV